MVLHSPLDKRNEVLGLAPTISRQIAPTNKNQDILTCKKCLNLRKRVWEAFVVHSRRIGGEENFQETTLWRNLRPSFCSSNFLGLNSNPSLKSCVRFFLTWTLVVGPAIQLIWISLFSKTALFGAVLQTEACHPGHNGNGGSRPRSTFDFRPFQFGEYVPKVSELTIGASGPSEGPVHRNTDRYKKTLSRVVNPDVQFITENGVAVNQVMTHRCQDRLNLLAILVLNQWPGVKVRVTKAWVDPQYDESYPDISLHHEGRAIDIITGDKDINKYPLLARLAVEAGFDWVKLKKFHVHCSVKSDSSPASEYGGCFPGDALVPTPGRMMKRMDELRSGDEVWAVDSTGKIIRDEILTFMDIQRDQIDGVTLKRMFVSIKTKTGKTIRMTRNHMIFKGKSTSNIKSNFSNTFEQMQSPIASFAAKIKSGETLFDVDFPLQPHSAILRQAVVTDVQFVTSTSGAFAPLTKTGTIVVDNVVASCYAVVESHKMAHAATAPIRYFYSTKRWLNLWTPFPVWSSNSINLKTLKKTNESCVEEGVMFFAKALYSVGSKIIPSDLFWGD